VYMCVLGVVCVWCGFQGEERLQTVGTDSSEVLLSRERDKWDSVESRGTFF